MLDNILYTILYSILPLSLSVVGAVIIVVIGSIFTLRHYKKLITLSLKNESLKKEDLYIFLKRGLITYRSLDNILRRLFENSLKTDPESENTEKLRELIVWFEEQEGFTELPKDVRRSLEDIQKQTPEVRLQINRLAESLKELYRTHSQREARLRLFSYISGAVGILGVIIGVVQSVI